MPAKKTIAAINSRFTQFTQFLSEQLRLEKLQMDAMRKRKSEEVIQGIASQIRNNEKALRESGYFDLPQA